MRIFRIFTLAVIVCVALAQPGNAVCPEDGATPFTIGQLNPLNGFPEVVLDSNGLALELCLDGAVCFFDPVEVGNPFSEQIGFGLESFWFLADASVTGEAGNAASLGMAVEAAFTPELVADGNQTPFTRLRIRIDAPVTGTYTVVHPYGTIVYENVIAGLKAINDTVDLPFAAGDTHQGRVGPFLRWDPSIDPQPPVGFIGDINIPHEVVGSPCGFNFFRVSAVDTNNVAIDLNGPNTAGDDLETDLFSIAGKEFNGLFTVPLTVDRASYSRPSSGGLGRVNIFATATTNATITAENAPELPLVTLAQDGGRFFTSYEVQNTSTLPSTVIIRASAAGFNDGVAVAQLIDEIVINDAYYDIINNNLVIRAVSSDKFSSPVLTLSDGLGVVVSGVARTIENVTVPPASITVSSSAGGVATREVSIVERTPLFMLVAPAISNGGRQQ